MCICRELTRPAGIVLLKPDPDDYQSSFLFPIFFSFFYSFFFLLSLFILKVKISSICAKAPKKQNKDRRYFTLSAAKQIQMEKQIK